MRVAFAVMAAFVVLVVSSGAYAQDSFTHTVYTEGRYIHDGEARLNVSNGSEIGGAYFHFPSGQGAMIDGRYRISDWPISIGAQFNWMTGDWTTRDRLWFGPSLQLRWGRARVWDFYLRFNILVDCQEGDLGAIEFRMQYLRNFRRIQIIPIIQATIQGEDNLPEYYSAWEAQLTAQVELSGYWRNWTYVRPLGRIESTNWWQFGGDHRGFISLEVGAKGEWLASSWATFWYQLAGGLRIYYGDGFQGENIGGVVIFSIGVSFH